MNKINILLLSLVPALASTANNDTIRVEKAFYSEAYKINKPFLNDSLDANKKKLDFNDMLERNAKPSVAKTLLSRKQTISSQSPIASPTTAIHYIAFSITPDRYANCELIIPKMKNIKIFQDGKIASKSMNLEPYRHEIVIACLTDETSTDTFDISLKIPQDAKVEINSTSKSPYTIADQTQGLKYSDVRISPTGKYLLTSISETDENGKSSYSFKLTETASGKLIYRNNGYLSYNWMPNEDKIYCTRSINGKRNLILVEPVSNKETIWAEDIPEGYFKMAPNGNFLIYSIKNEKSRKSGAMIKVDTPDDRVGPQGDIYDLFLYEKETGLLQRLTYGNTNTNLSDISPDSKKLLFMTHNVKFDRFPTSYASIKELNIETMEVDTLVSDTGFINSASYSPDASKVIILGSPDAFSGIGHNMLEGQTANLFDVQMYILDKKTKNVEAVSKNFNPSINYAKWNRKDNNIYIIADNRDCTHLFQYNVKQKKYKYIDTKLDVIQNFSISPNGLYAAVTGQTGDKARILNTLSLENGKIQKDQDIDFDKTYADTYLSPCIDWNFKSSQGDTICGRYYLPINFDKNKKYPVIVYYYGGCVPTKRTAEFQYPYQVLAGQGYIVYVVQPSGAIGYGQEFSARHVNAWGKRTADEIIEGTKKFLESHPYADKDRVAPMGASYGGFMTQYLVTQTDMFRTAISHAGISNIASYWGGGNWGWSYNQVAATGSYPWNNPNLYVKQSPLFNADKIHTPLLLLHGTADTNVPTNESQQLYTALRLLGRDVSFIKIDGENHVITDWGKRIQWQKTIFAWFAKWLKDEPEWWNEFYE